MRILVVTQGYFPAKAYGGPPVSIENFCNLLQKNLEIYIVTADHEYQSSDRLEGILDGWNKVGNAKVLYLSEEKKNIRVFSKIVKEINPDWIYLNSLFDASNVLAFLEIANNKNIKVLMAPRGELCSGAFKKKYKKLPYIAYLRMRGLLKKVIFQSTSDEETVAIKKFLGASNKNIHFLPNIPSIPLEIYRHSAKKVGKAKFVFLSRIHSKKNLLAAIKVFKFIDGDIQFDIYGPLEDKKYWNECQMAIKNLPDNIVVNYCGCVTHKEVHEVFSNYHAFIFPTFSENFGHVVAEALSVGCPVIISDQTPWNDVNVAKAGRALAVDDIDGFVNAIQAVVNMNEDEFVGLSNNARKFALKKYNLEKTRANYLKILNKIY